MMKLVDAISHRFPQENPWAGAALASLTDQLDPLTPIHELVEGWIRVGDEPTGRLHDVLFVLTDRALGIGRSEGVEAPRWVDLASIRFVDAIEGSLYPLQTISIELHDGNGLFVGWPTAFTKRLIPLLVALRTQPEVQAAPEPAPTPTPTQPAPALGFLAVPRERPAAPDLDPELAALLAASITSSPAPTPTVGLTIAPPAPDAPQAPDVAQVPDEPAAPAAEVDTEAHTAFFEGDGLDDPDAAPVPTFGSDSRAPWDAMGSAWPTDIPSVTYLGGHPDLKRKRKGGVAVFGPRGLEVKGTGVGRWEMNLDWAYVRDVDVQGADEIMFSEALRVAPTSSVLVVEMTDSARLFFEVSGRRPPSLRSEIAAVISMVAAGRTYRATTAAHSE